MNGWLDEREEERESLGFRSLLFSFIHSSTHPFIPSPLASDLNRGNQ